MQRGYEKELNSLVGETIEMNISKLTPTGTNLRSEKFLVVAAYPHYIIGERTCENGHVCRECFNIGDLISMGLIMQKGRMEYYG